MEVELEGFRAGVMGFTGTERSSPPVELPADEYAVVLQAVEWVGKPALANFQAYGGCARTRCPIQSGRTGQATVPSFRESR